ncbi:hypothetical protein BLA50215_07995 [Burkholderia lata]|uniref:hypothetical protein n=1 Tax=Burkholderia lata (strain ATCC 17760 / DSM 23089 / LMG 22485 / NCIMB 9086 / R18194 / 383) TaxID=482957 RepID=UPI001453C709|nr:hypothetical protein [Burkholderia lata]VWD65416.1 hypothetical protein BLA50215_07995 [Burkholderia lata]
MKFDNFDDLIFFLRRRWLPFGVEEVKIKRYESHLYYSGPIKTLADKLLPEIEMIANPDAEEWGEDEEEMGMEWENSRMSISASPIDEGEFLIIVSEKIQYKFGGGGRILGLFRR